MIFNLQKFLVDNRLTKRARLKEDAETKTDAEQLAMSDEEDGEEMFDPASADPYGGEYNGYDKRDDLPPVIPQVHKDREAGKSGVKTNKATKDLYTKEMDLKKLESEKDALLLKLRSGQLSMDQYREQIGNIPQQIKKLRADLQQSTAPAIDDSEEETQ